MNSRALVFLLAAALLGLGGFFVLSESGPDAGAGDGGAAPGTQVADDPEPPQTSQLASALSVEGGSASAGNRVAAEVDAGAMPGESAATKSLNSLSKATVTGRVIDSLGQGLGGVQLELKSRVAGDQLGSLIDVQLSNQLQGRAGASALSESDGSFSMEVAGTGAFRLSVLAEGYERLTESLNLDSGQRLELFDLTLTEGCILAGRVVDANGAPVPGAGLNLSTQTGQQIFASFRAGSSNDPDATTDASGSFRLSHAPAGDWEVRVTHDEHPAKSFQGEAAGVGSTVSGLLFELDRAAEISGSIVGFVPGSKLRVFAFDASAAEEGTSGLQTLGRRRVKSCDVDAGGTWMLRGLKADRDYDLELYEERPTSFGFESISERAVQARAGDAGVALDYRPGWELAMQVVDSRTGEPIEDYKFIFGPQFSVQGAEPSAGPPFAEGRSSYSNLRMPSRAWYTGGPTARVEAQGYAARKVEIPEMPSGGQLDLGQILLDPVPSLTVRVTDLETGDPVEGARVARSIQTQGRSEGSGAALGSVSMRRSIRVDGEAVDWSPGFASTDSDGIAVLDGLPGERVDLTVTHGNYAPSRVEDLPPTDEPSEVAVELGPGGQVEVRVVDESGQPVPGVEVSHTEGLSGDGLESASALLGSFGGGRGAVTATDSEGLVRFLRLPYGTHGFRIQEDQASPGAGLILFDDDSGPDWTEVLVTDSGLVEIQLVLLEKSEVTGRITQVGVPLAGASVSSRRDDPDAGPLAGFGGAISLGGDSGVRTNNDGEYRLDGLEPGDYVLEIRHASRALPAEVPFTVVGRSERVDADLSINAIEGRVLDTNGEPLAGVVVRAETPGSSQAISIFFSTTGDSGPSGGILQSAASSTVLTEDDGRYRLQGLPAETELRVVADPPSSLGSFTSAKSELLTVGPEETREEVDIVCPEGGAIRVLLDFGSDNPSPVILMARSEGQVSRTEMIQGRTEMLLEGLAAGDWNLTASRIGPSVSLGGNGGEQVEVVPGQTIDVTLVP